MTEPPIVTSEALNASYRLCEQISRTEARNFYWSFLTLPEAKRQAMCAVYAFMRHSDDVSDEPGEAQTRDERMADWSRVIRRALEVGDCGDSKILPAFRDTVIRYKIPHEYIYALIEGTGMDLKTTRYQTFDELRNYCYHVASVVGFVCIHVWGFDHNHPLALNYAESCGYAFQLTNILRDVKEDAELGRIYLPEEDCKRYGVTEEQVLAGKATAAFRAVIKLEAERARAYYAEAEKLLPLLHPDGRPTYRVMLKIYRGILDQIVSRDYDVISQRARVSSARKLAILAGAWLSSRFGIRR